MPTTVHVSFYSEEVKPLSTDRFNAVAYPAFHFLGGINFNSEIKYLLGWELVALALLSLWGTMHGNFRGEGINPFIPIWGAPLTHIQHQLMFNMADSNLIQRRTVWVWATKCAWKLIGLNGQNDLTQGRIALRIHSIQRRCISFYSLYTFHYCMVILTKPLCMQTSIFGACLKPG